VAKGIPKRSEDYSGWYTALVQRAELADYAPVKGCMVIRPYGFAIWEKVQAALDGMFKATGHVNAYFPLFIPESFMKKEAEHVEGFAPQCAVVTHGGGAELEEPLYIRPTSETVIWSMYGRWIQSYRDLPLLINQWANIVRWEMRTRLFLRTTEFLWQEGHTAHATEQEAIEETTKMLEVYRVFAEEYMAAPVIKGIKTESEKFAGAVRTYCIEAMMQDGKALQAGTSHYLGQNFAKAFNVQFQSPEGQLEYVYATSWGVSTRLIGALVMAHSDDDGLVLPPKLAPIHVVIVPIFKGDAERPAVLAKATALKNDLSPAWTVRLDDRENYTAGWKFNEWELKGVPVRIEIGPRDVEKNQVVMVRRDTRQKTPVALDRVKETVTAQLTQMQGDLFNRALKFRDENTCRLEDYDSFKKRMDMENAGFVQAHWCGSAECEAAIQEETKATIRCIPLSRPEEKGACVRCGKPSEGRVVMAKAY
jgi:prolyl-tRNA synthetase